MRIDFQEVKARVPIEEAAKVLLPDLKESNGEQHQFRASCPTCKTGGDRALVVTVGKGAYCNVEKRGGDVLFLCQHTLGVSIRQAAEWLVDRFQLATPPQTPPPQTARAPAPAPVAPPPEPPKEPEPDGLQPLKHLDAAHDAVKALKLPQDVAEALGVGYCSKGLMKSKVAIPLRLPSGKLIGYIGVTEAKLPSSFKL